MVDDKSNSQLADRDVFDQGMRLDVPGCLGAYELRDRIGAGGMGEVYLGYDWTLGRRVALKVLPAELARHTDFVQRFYTEASAAARLMHPNVIPIHFIGEDQGRHFFVMPYIEGESLAARLSRQGRLSVDEALPIVDDLLSGLAAAHAQGLVHRDIKPGNILLEAPSGRAVVADFGLVKSLGDAGGRTATGVVLGTVDYMAPEQSRGRTVDHRCDLYAVGVLLYQMLSGRLPFAADSPTGMIFEHAYERPAALPELVPDFPLRLWLVVARLMAKSPDVRYASAQEVRDDLQAILRKRPLPSGTERLDPEAFWRPMPGRSDNRPLSVIVETPTFDGELEEPALRPSAGGWWDRLRERSKDWWASRRPEWAAALETTQQQADGAIAEYQHRRDYLKSLVREGERVLADLNAQRGRAPAQADLPGLIHGQVEQLDSMRLKLAQVEATLGRLRAQRDVLNARLKAARARRQIGAPANRRRGLVPTAAQVAVLLVLASVLVVIVRAQWPYIVAFFSVSPPKESPVRARQAVVPTSRYSAGEPLIPTEVLSGSLVHTTLLSTDARLASFSADGGFIGIVSKSGLIEFRGATDGQLLNSMELPTTKNESLLTDANGRYLAREITSAPGKGNAIELRDLQNPGQPVSTIAVNDSAKAFAIGGEPPVVWTFSAADGAKLQAWTPSGVEATAITRNTEHPTVWVTDLSGRRVALGTGSHEVQVFNLASESSTVTTTVLPTPAQRLAFHPRESWLAVVASAGDQVVLWDLDTRQPRAELNQAGETVRDLAFDRSGRRLAVVSENRIRVWDVELHCVRLVVPASKTQAFSFSPDGAQLTSVDADGNLTIWPTALPVLQSDLTSWLKSLDETRAAAIEPYRPIRSGGSPRRASTLDGRLTVVAPPGEAPHLEETATQEKVFDFPIKSVLSVAVSPNGKWAVTGGYEREQGTGDIRQWDLRSGREIGKFPGHIHHANSLAFSPDSRFLLSGGKGTMYLWDVATRSEIRRFSISFPFVKQVAFSPDGRHALARHNGVGPQHNRNVLFSVATGEALWDFDAEVPEWAFSPPEIFADSQFGQWRTFNSDGETKP